MENLSEVTAYSNMTSSVFSAQSFCIFSYIWPHLNRSSFYLQRKYTQHWEDTKDHIYFMQTDTPVYDTHKKAGTAASEVNAHTHRPSHTHNHSGNGYFYRSTLMWKTRQRADPCLRAERESTQRVCSDAGIVPFCTHTGTAWQRDLPLVLSNCANWACVPTLLRCNNLSECVKRLFSHPHVHTHNTDKRHHPWGAAMNEHPKVILATV